MKPFYPERVNSLWRGAKHLGRPDEFDSRGTGVSFECGVSVKIFLSVDPESVLSSVRFVSNGCGWAAAAAEAAAGTIEGRRLKDLHALDDLRTELGAILGPVPRARRLCIEIAIEGVRNALAEYRSLKVSEWKGETALICSCFGVSEETIESLAASGAVSTVEEVGDRCRAGTGCGSCQMLIREIVESTARMSDE